MKRFKFRNVHIEAQDHGGKYSFAAVYKGRQTSWMTTDATLYDDVDGNERRSAAARAYVYEKIKELYFKGDGGIWVGRRYEALSDIMDAKGKVCYQKGVSYPCEQSGCITDELGDTAHSWVCDDFEIYFKKV